MKRVICTILALIMCTTFCIPASAASLDDRIFQQPIEKTMQEINFSSMSIGELNAFIHSIAVGAPTNSSRGNALSLAWIAAAEIAAKAGYPCAGAVVKASANGDDYIESNGLLANTIKTTDAFSNWKVDLGDYIVFEKSDSSDLFYAIHNADIGISGKSSGARARITDTFDFVFETDMEDLFSTLVNDWGWLSQNLGALTAIRVQVDITL